MKRNEKKKSMNAKLLDNQLRKLTAEEIEARDGKETDYSGFQFIEDSGKNYFLMTREKYLSPLYLVCTSYKDLFL